MPPGSPAVSVTLRLLGDPALIVGAGVKALDRVTCERHAREAEALAVIEPHRAWVETHGSDENRCEFLADRSWALTKLSRLHEARDSLQQALAIAERSGNQSDVGSILHLLASVENRLGLAAAAVERAAARHRTAGPARPSQRRARHSAAPAWLAAA